ncbi:MAG: RNase adapter RapZ [Collinsella sp.]
MHDNLPPRLIAQLAELVGINTGVGRHLAVTCDLRSQGCLMSCSMPLPPREREMSCDIVFSRLDEVLIRRYSENRRRHPIAKPGETTADAIQRERLQLRVCAIEPI